MKEYLTTEGDGLTITYSAPTVTDSVVYTVTDIDLDEVVFADEALINNDMNLNYHQISASMIESLELISSF
jgi:hypothetical protein